MRKKAVTYICPLCHLKHHTSVSRCPETKQSIPVAFRMQGRLITERIYIPPA